MKIDSEEAKKLFESCSYVLDMKNALKVIKSENVYDVFSHIDEVYEEKKKKKT